jgi:molybdopterin synthase catalytic subunit
MILCSLVHRHAGVSRTYGDKGSPRRQTGHRETPYCADVDAIRLLDIRETPLSVDEVLAAVSHPGAGGTTLFIGTVRDQDHGRPVDALDYTAHPTVHAALRQVAERIVADYPVLALAAVHRVGELNIGDVAVVTAVACPHRGEAFDACRKLIDEIKATAPVWKHQVFSDGTDEWVGTP